MQFVPAKPRSAWRVFILSVAAILTLGVLAPVTASAHSTAWLRVHDTAVFLHHHGGYMPRDGGYMMQGGDQDRWGDHDGYRYHHKYVTAKVKITLSKALKKKASVGWYTKSATARAWKDFVPAGGRVYFKKGQKVAYVKVLVKDSQPWIHRDRCEVQLPDNTFQPAPNGYEPRRDDRGDHDGYGYHHNKFGKFFLVKLVNPRGARIADGLGIVKIISKDFRYGDRGDDHGFPGRPGDDHGFPGRPGDDHGFPGRPGDQCRPDGPVITTPADSGTVTPTA